MNLDVTQSNYTTWPECNCKVHAGWNNGVNLVWDNVLAEVTRLQALYPTYTVKVTGHSLGAALAQLTGMRLIQAGFNVSMINFGQPRTGDTAYAAFSNTKFPQQWRVVNHKDQVPHLPIPDMNYFHVRTEAYEDADGSVKLCDASGEDSTCADQWPLIKTNWTDHLIYLGVDMSCVNSFLQ